MACRGDWADNVLNSNQCLETCCKYKFKSPTSVPVLYAIRLTSFLMLRLHHLSYDDHPISRDTCPVSLSITVHLSLIHSFTMAEYTHTEYTQHGVSAQGSCRQWESCSSDLSRALFTSCDHSIPCSPKLFNSSRKELNRADCGAPRWRCTPNFEKDILHYIEKTSQWVPNHCTWNVCAS